MMQRCCSRLRHFAAAGLHGHHHPNTHRTFTSGRLLYTIPNLPHKPHIITHPVISSKCNPLFDSTQLPSLCHSPLYLTQVRHLTLKQRKRKLKSRRPMTPVISKVKKIKIKGYSSYKGRFKAMKDGTIKRWKEGKRHNAHLKSKKSKRRLRQPGIVPLAYAKVMKKLNFCG